METSEKTQSYSVCKNKEFSAHLQKERTKIFIVGNFYTKYNKDLSFATFTHRPIIFKWLMEADGR